MRPCSRIVAAPSRSRFHAEREGVGGRTSWRRRCGSTTWRASWGSPTRSASNSVRASVSGSGRPLRAWTRRTPTGYGNSPNGTTSSGAKLRRPKLLVTPRRRRWHRRDRWLPPPLFRPHRLLLRLWGRPDRLWGRPDRRRPRLPRRLARSAPPRGPTSRPHPLKVPVPRSRRLQRSAPRHLRRPRPPTGGSSRPAAALPRAWSAPHWRSLRSACRPRRLRRRRHLLAQRGRRFRLRRRRHLLAQRGRRFRLRRRRHLLAQRGRRFRLRRRRHLLAQRGRRFRLRRRRHLLAQRGRRFRLRRRRHLLAQRGRPFRLRCRRHRALVCRLRLGLQRRRHLPGPHRLPGSNRRLRVPTERRRSAPRESPSRPRRDR